MQVGVDRMVLEVLDRVGSQDGLRFQWRLEGIASVAAGVIAFVWPGLTVLAFVLLIAALSIVSGRLCSLQRFKPRVAASGSRWAGPRRCSTAS